MMSKVSRADFLEMFENLPTNPKEYPPPAFYFTVNIVGVSVQGGADTSFQEVSGISSEMDIEDVVEGGENRFVHHLPKGIKHSNLVLKRGVADKDSPLVDWCSTVLEGDSLSVDAKEINVSLLGEEGAPFLTWSFFNAFPVRWELAGFNSMENNVAIETMEFRYSYSQRIV